MNRPWDGCLREVVGKCEAPLTGVWLTMPPMRGLKQRRPYVRRMVALLECGHTKVGNCERTLKPGVWVMCSDCREGRPSGTKQR